MTPDVEPDALPELAPFLPESEDPLGDVGAFKNHYRNAAALEERTLSAFVAALRASATATFERSISFAPRVDDVATRYGGVTCEHVLLPVWVCAYRDSDRSDRLRVDGQTGGGTSESPISKQGVAFLVIGVNVPKWHDRANGGKGLAR